MKNPTIIEPKILINAMIDLGELVLPTEAIENLTSI